MQMRNNDALLPGLNNTQRRRGQRTGYLRAVNGTWLLTFRQYVLNPETGKSLPHRKTVSIGPAPSDNGKARGDDLTKKQAQRIAWTVFLAPLDATIRKPGLMLTLEQFWVQHYESHIVRKRKYSTVNQYKSLWKLWIQPLLGNVKLSELNPITVDTVCSEVQNSGKGTATVRHVKKVIGAMLEHARVLQMFTGENPAHLVELPPHVPVRKPRAMTIEQCRLWLDTVSDELPPKERRIKRPPSQLTSPANTNPQPLRTMSMLGICCSLGISEQLGLKWGQVNLSDLAVIRDGEFLPARSAAIVEHCYHGHPGSLKTGSRRRNVPLPAILVTALARLHSETAWKSPDDPVFAGATGKPIWGDNLARRALKPAARELGMPWLSFHVFRHTCATLSYGLHMLDIDRRALMGHADRSMTDHYTHGDYERMRAAVELLANEIISAAPRKPVERAEPDPKLFAEFFHG
jgi:integrase